MIQFVHRSMLSALLALLIGASLAAPAFAQGVTPEEAARIRAMAEKVEPIVAEMRGKEWKFSVDKGIYTRDQLRAMMMQDQDMNEMRADAGKEAALLAKMGLLDRSFDLLEAYLALYGGAVAGFYSPDTRELNLVKSDGNEDPAMKAQDMMMRAMLGVSQDEMVMAHELTHALDDQHFDLLNLADQEKMNSDERLAYLAVIEGAAVSLQYDFLFKRQGLKSYENPAMRQMLEEAPGSEGVPGVTPGMPEFIVKTLIWPYSVANRLVFAARKRDNGGWQTVDKMYEDLPASSEQVLHPEKYLDLPRDYPTVLALPDETNMAAMLGEGWTEIDRDTMGEFRLWIYFEEIFKDRRSAQALAKRTAAGWDGDTMVALTKGENHEDVAIVWVSTWDTENDAVEFFNLYRNVLQVKYENAPADTDNTTSYAFNDTATTNVIIERRGKDVVIVESVPADRARGIVEAGFNAERKNWVRPPRSNRVPKRGPGSAIESENFKGTTYENAEFGYALELPRDGFALIQEEDGAIALRAPETDRDQHISVKDLDTTTQEFAATGFEDMKKQLTGILNQSRVIVDRKFSDNGREAWKFVASGFSPAGKEVVVAAIITAHADDRLIAVVVSANKEAFTEIAADLVEVNASVRVMAKQAADGDGE